jgi:transposase-like protein
MVYTQPFCAQCGSDQIRRNGHRQGHARYQCKVCRYQARFEPAAVAKAAQYEQVNTRLGERNSQRSIVRATGVARMTVAKSVKKSAEKTLGSPGTGGEVAVWGPQAAQSLAVARRRADQPPHHRLDSGLPRRDHCAPPLASPAQTRPPALLVLYRGVESVS